MVAWSVLTQTSCRWVVGELNSTAEPCVRCEPTVAGRSRLEMTAYSRVVEPEPISADGGGKKSLAQRTAHA